MSSATLGELLHALDSGTTLLLPNARAAQSLRARFSDRQRVRGLAAWEPAQALSWAQWANAQWSELVVAGAENRLLLNTAQEHSLWRELIEADEETELIGTADALAELARSAWHLAASYNATQRLREFVPTHDSRAFAGWAETFSRLCTSRGYVSQALLNAALLRHLENRTLHRPAALSLAGFVELQPSQQTLLTALRSHGTQVSEWTLEYDGAKCVRSCAAVEKEPQELHLAAHWLRETVEDAQAEGREVRVALLVPQLNEERAEVEEVLRQTLAPELQSVAEDLSSAPWEITGGAPLAAIAMVADALSMARWAEGALPVARVSELLLSPYVSLNGEDREALAASARFDAGKLRRASLLRPEIDVRSTLELAEDWIRSHPQDETSLSWLQAVHGFVRKAGDLRRPRGFAAWMEFVRGVAKAAGWPGARALTASEFATTTAWESVLDLVATLDFSGASVTLEAALAELERQAQATLSSAPSADAPVQVMTVAEAEGSVFDAVVFVHATDANLPAAERVHPLLPWALQRSLGMPGSDGARSAMKGRAATEDLLRRTGNALFIYAKENESGALRPSPLLAQLGLEKMSESHFAQREERQDTEFLSAVDNEPLPALHTGELRGGATVLRLQAACGFLAFAQLRLRAGELENNDLGLDAGESGSVLHRALQHFWQTVETQEALRLLRDEELEGILSRSIENAWPKRLNARDTWDVAYISVLKDRLRSVLRRWFEIELQRGPFTVLETEGERKVAVGPLTLDVRLDRVDQVSDGGYFLVDYKTGHAAEPKLWEGDRPEEPQLPLYALLPEAGALKGLAFARVRTGKDMKWVGYQAEEGILPKSRSNVRDMTTLVEEWRQTLTVLAEDFAQGRAGVRPKSFDVNCKRCEQRLLCRVDPTVLGVEREDEDGGREDGGRDVDV